MSPPRGSSIDERSSRGRSPVRQGSANNSVDETGLNIYVNGLSYSTTDHDLHKEFGKFGKIIECKVILDPRTRESRGFAFVKFASVDDGEKALVLNGFELGGRRLIVEKVNHQWEVLFIFHLTHKSINNSNRLNERVLGVQRLVNIAVLVQEVLSFIGMRQSNVINSFLFKR